MNKRIFMLQRQYELHTPLKMRSQTGEIEHRFR